MARPRPRPAPVTNATSPVRSKRGKSLATAGISRLLQGGSNTRQCGSTIAPVWDCAAEQPAVERLRALDGLSPLTIRLSSWVNDLHGLVPTEQNQILVPGSAHAVLQLFLPCANPRSIVLLGYLDASMPE